MMSNDVQESNVSLNGKKLKVKKGSWKRLLDSYIDGNREKQLSIWFDNKLTLLSYSRIGKINLDSNSAVIKSIQKNTLVPIRKVHKGMNNLNSFQLIRVEDNKSSIEKYRNYKRSLLKKFGTEFVLVKLKWSYDGVIFTNQAFVSTVLNRIVYNDIFMQLLIVNDLSKNNYEKNNMRKSIFPLYENFTEEPGTELNAMDTTLVVVTASGWDWTRATINGTHYATGKWYTDPSDNSKEKYLTGGHSNVTPHSSMVINVEVVSQDHDTNTGLNGSYSYSYVYKATINAVGISISSAGGTRGVTIGVNELE